MEKKVKNDIWVPLYIGDYLADTIGLSRSEHGAYLLAIMAYWRKGGPLTEKEVRSIMGDDADSVLRFFSFDDGFWWHKRIDAEIVASIERKENQMQRTRKATEARLKRNVDVTGNVTFTSSSSSSSSSSKSSSPSQSENITTHVEKTRHSRAPSPETMEIFDYWRDQLKHPQATLDKKRQAAIEARLKEGYAIVRIKQAIRGIKNCPHNMGQNERHTIYDDIELICRTGANIDRFADAEGHRSKPFQNFETNVAISPLFKEAK